MLMQVWVFYMVHLVVSLCTNPRDLGNSLSEGQFLSQSHDY